MTSAFENLSGPGKPIRTEPSDKKEFECLIRSGLQRGTCTVSGEESFRFYTKQKFIMQRWQQSIEKGTAWILVRLLVFK